MRTEGGGGEGKVKRGGEGRANVQAYDCSLTSWFYRL